MTDLLKLLQEKIKELDIKETEFNDLHRQAKRKKQNEIVPLQVEVRNLLVKVHGTRKSNYKITSE